MDAVDGELRHYHDKTGLECDALLQDWAGNYALDEIKLGGDNLINEAVDSLLKLDSLIKDKKQTPPASKMVVTATGDFAYTRQEDGIIVCPLSALRP